MGTEIIIYTEAMAFQRQRDGKWLVFQIDRNNRVTFLSADGTEQGSTRPLTSVQEAKSFIVSYARSEGYGGLIEVVEPDKILRTY